jgi:putative phosphoesterase
MKVAVLSDIHGNSVALKAVVGEMKKQTILRVLILGDFVGYYYRPDEVLDLLSEFETTSIRGNHENMLRATRANTDMAHEIELQYGHGITKAMERLSREQLDLLCELPETRSVQMGDVRFFLCHGSPWRNDEYIYPDAPLEVLEKCAAMDANFVAMGHTHHPFIHRGRGATVFNPGSVGQARDSSGAASWAIVDTDNSEVVFKRTPFDIMPIIGDVIMLDPNLPYLHDILRR